MAIKKYHPKRFTLRYKWPFIRNKGVRFLMEMETHLYSASCLKDVSKTLLSVYVGRHLLFLNTSLFVDDIQHRLCSDKTETKLISHLKCVAPTEVVNHYNEVIESSLTKLLECIKHQLAGKIICEISISNDYTLTISTLTYMYKETQSCQKQRN